jgi:hypothetical protein
VFVSSAAFPTFAITAWSIVRTSSQYTNIHATQICLEIMQSDPVNRSPVIACEECRQRKRKVSMHGKSSTTLLHTSLTPCTVR